MTKKAISITLDTEILDMVKTNVKEKGTGTISSQIEECIRAFYIHDEGEDFKTLLKKLNAEHNKVIRMYNALKDEQTDVTADMVFMQSTLDN